MYLYKEGQMFQRLLSQLISSLYFFQFIALYRILYLLKCKIRFFSLNLVLKYVRLS